MRSSCHLLAVIATCVLAAGCSAPTAEPSASAPKLTAIKASGAFAATSGNAAPVADPESAPPVVPRFVDRHTELGIDFQYDNGAAGKALMVESTGGGGGWIDFDRDGWFDLILVQGGDPLAEIPHPRGDRLLRNVDGRQFTDVTDSARPIDRGYGQGLAIGDFDGDGFEDILITNVGPDVLWKNQGDGTFQDITGAAGVGDPRWGTSAAWFDLDVDGDLDLFVCNYLHYDVRNPVACRRDDGTPSVCHPESVDPEQSECYENLGDGTFRPAAARWGLLAPNGKSLGLVITDLNGDRVPDVFVANDTAANHLFVGLGGGRFEERGVAQGCAYNALGQYQANMGVACNDYDGNGFPDLYITTFTNDSNTLFANLGLIGFRDVTRIEGLHIPTLETLGFGTVMQDFNADGAMDLINANGHIDDWRDRGDLWKMRPELLSYAGRRWVLHDTAVAGDYFAQERLGRAIASADYDRDGDLDLLVIHQDGPAALLVNESELGRWLQVELIGQSLERRAYGSRVTVTQGQRNWTQQLAGGTSYCAAHEPILFFGLGASAEPVSIEVEWLASRRPRVTLQNVAVNQRITIREQ